MSYFIYQEKRIYYSESGKGNPVVFLHGNTASSRMFEMLLPLYEEHFKVILVDFLGHGRSDRLTEFPADLWQEEARQIIALLEHLDYGKVSLVGSSGGAWAAVNAGLLRPDLVGKVVADSFDGHPLGCGGHCKGVSSRRFLARYYHPRSQSGQPKGNFIRPCGSCELQHSSDKIFAGMRTKEPVNLPVFQQRRGLPARAGKDCGNQRRGIGAEQSALALRKQQAGWGAFVRAVPQKL